LGFGISKKSSLRKEDFGKSRFRFFKLEKLDTTGAAGNVMEEEEQ
jgi:hypothetical protein